MADTLAELKKLAKELAHDAGLEYENLSDDQREVYFLQACDIYRERRWSRADRKAKAKGEGHA